MPRSIPSTPAKPACTCSSGKQVVIPAPPWIDKPNGIAIDPCIADTIRMLWDNKIATLGCCCGHNRIPPSVVLAESVDATRARQLLADHDSRPWRALQWRLVDTSTPLWVHELRLNNRIVLDLAYVMARMGLDDISTIRRVMTRLESLDDTLSAQGLARVLGISIDDAADRLIAQRQP